MNRREFAKTAAGAAFSMALPANSVLDAAADVKPTVPFKLSVMLWTVNKQLPFEQRLEKVAEAGYGAVELVNEFLKWSDEDFRRMNNKKRSLGITFDATAGVWKGMKRAADLAAKQNVTLLLENIDQEENPKYYLTSVAEGFEIIRKVDNPHVKFLYDFFHEQISEGNLIKKLETNINEVGLVHIADVPGRHEPGTGEINYMNIFRKLAELKYDRYAAMEFEPTGDVVTSLRGARELALRSVSALP